MPTHVSNRDCLGHMLTRGAPHINAASKAYTPVVVHQPSDAGPGGIGMQCMIAITALEPGVLIGHAKRLHAKLTTHTRPS